jgi:hypothetical protein
MVTSTTEWDYGYAETQEGRLGCPVIFAATGQRHCRRRIRVGIKGLLVLSDRDCGMTYWKERTQRIAVQSFWRLAVLLAVVVMIGFFFRQYLCSLAVISQTGSWL